jgi:chemotaxis protein CheD
MQSFRTPELGAALAGFEHINRYWDRVRQSVSVKLRPGEYYVTNRPENLVTTLGSCIAVCVWDPNAGVGGMNHFMLPGGCDPKDIDFSKPNDATRFGSYAMEHLINAIMRYGGERLLVKIAGGGCVLCNATDVGARNIAFILEYLRTERLQMLGQHVGGEWPRKRCFQALRGAAQVKELRQLANNTIVEREAHYADEVRNELRERPVEIFDKSRAP